MFAGVIPFFQLNKAPVPTRLFLVEGIFEVEQYAELVILVAARAPNRSVRTDDDRIVFAEDGLYGIVERGAVLFQHFGKDVGTGGRQAQPAV